MLKIRYNDKYFLAVVCFIIAAITLWDSKNFKGYGETARDIIGPNVFPNILAIGLIFCGVILIYKGFRNPVKLEATLKFKSEFFIFLLAMLIYYLSLDLVGYIIMSLIFMGFIVWLLGVRNLRLITEVSVVVVSIIYIIFHVLLKVQLPGGILF